MITELVKDGTPEVLLKVKINKEMEYWHFLVLLVENQLHKRLHTVQQSRQHIDTVDCDQQSYVDSYGYPAMVFVKYP